WACKTWWRNRWARPTPTIWCAPPSMRSSARTRRVPSPHAAISRYQRCRRAGVMSARVSRPQTKARQTRGEADMSKTDKIIKVDQAGSAIRRHHTQRETLIGLGLNRIGRIVELPDTPQTRGMIAKMRHLVRVVDAQGERR